MLRLISKNISYVGEETNDAYDGRNTGDDNF
jgi:hypothetical protein